MNAASISLCTLLASLLVASGPARAAEPPPEIDSHTRTAARSLASQGTEAFERQDYATALDLFRRASSLVPAPTITLMEARTLVELGRWVEAVDVYAGVQRAREDAENPAFRQAAEEAARESAALMARLPRLRVTAPPGESISVELDGRVLVPALVGVDNPVDPGLHRVEARRGQELARSYEVTLAAGEHRELVLELPRAAPAPAPRPAPVPPPRQVDADQPASRLTVPAAVAFGAGGVGVVVGTISGIIALGKRSDLDAACDPELGCPETSESTLSAYRFTRTLSYVGFGVGALGIAAGTYFVLSSAGRSGEVTVAVAPASVSLQGAF